MSILCDIGNSFKTYIYVSFSKLGNITSKVMNNLNIALVSQAKNSISARGKTPRTSSPPEVTHAFNQQSDAPTTFLLS